MIIAKHPGIRSNLARMARDAGISGLSRLKDVTLVTERDHIFLFGEFNGRFLLYQGNFYQIGIDALAESNEFMARRILNEGREQVWDITDVCRYVSTLGAETIIATGDDGPGDFFQPRRGRL